jgi:hypothetical protein
MIWSQVIVSAGRVDRHDLPSLSALESGEVADVLAYIKRVIPEYIDLRRPRTAFASMNPLTVQEQSDHARTLQRTEQLSLPTRKDGLR